LTAISGSGTSPRSSTIPKIFSALFAAPDLFQRFVFRLGLQKGLSDFRKEVSGRLKTDPLGIFTADEHLGNWATHKRAFEEVSESGTRYVLTTHLASKPQLLAERLEVDVSEISSITWNYWREIANSLYGRRDQPLEQIEGVLRERVSAIVRDAQLHRQTRRP
jgi:hypothetical protein